MPLALLKGEKEKHAVFVQWTSQRPAVLSASERRFVYRREGITRLKTLVPQKAKNISLEFVAPTLGYYVDHTSGRTPKLWCE